MSTYCFQSFVSSLSEDIDTVKLGEIQGESDKLFALLRLKKLDSDDISGVIKLLKDIDYYSSFYVDDINVSLYTVVYEFRKGRTNMARILSIESRYLSLDSDTIVNAGFGQYMETYVTES